MAKLEILMPSMGESIFECTVIKWLVKEGDKVELDDLLIEVETDKIDTEIGSTEEGVITKFLVAEGDVVQIGQAICEIETEGMALVSESEPISPVVEEAVETLKAEIKETTGKLSSGMAKSGGDRFYSPLVLSIAKEERIAQAELDNISGTGKDGRVTKADMLAYLKGREIKQTEKPVETVPALLSGDDQVVEMDRMRKIIAQRMVDSKRISPHVTSFIETDMTRVFNWRKNIKESFLKLYNENITFTPIFVHAIVSAIKKYPGINIQVDDDKIIQKGAINIGMAVALPNGNLIVPVIHNADQYSLPQLAGKVNDLAQRARNNQLKPAELSGGTYSFSNIGGFGNLAGTPIIPQPQVAIMAFGVIRKMPAVIETPEGDMIGIRQKMILSHSYDHRVVDGSLGGMFLKEVSDQLENFDLDILK